MITDIRNREKRIRIGTVAVNSGQLVICDPCYINHDGQQRELNNYIHMLQKRELIGNGDINRSGKYLQLNYDHGPSGLGVVFDSGSGDGIYDVYATIGNVASWDMKIRKVEIILTRE